MEKSRWILASASPQRRRTLQQLQIHLHTIDPALPEEEIGCGEAPVQRIQTLALAKAMVGVMSTRETTYVLGIDTAIVCRGTMWGKPSDAAEALRTLSSLQGRTHQIVTGYALLRLQDGQVMDQLLRTQATDVTLRSLSEDWQKWYVATEEWRGKAGGYALQGLGGLLVESITGDISNGVGLSLAVLLPMAAKLGVVLEPAVPRTEI